MNKKEALELFRALYPRESFVSQATGKIDIVARREGWNNYTDYLCKEGLISDKQYHEWLNPF